MEKVKEEVEELESGFVHFETDTDNYRCEDPSCIGTIFDLEDDPPFVVCRLCGTVQRSVGTVCEVPEYVPKVDYSAVPRVVEPVGSKPRGSGVVKSQYCSGLCSRRRYKREFYYKERLDQWMCCEPAVRREVVETFDLLMESGMYGMKRQVSRGTIMQMCKDHPTILHTCDEETLEKPEIEDHKSSRDMTLYRSCCRDLKRKLTVIKLRRYKENWKSILRHLNPRACCKIDLSTEEMEILKSQYKQVSREFNSLIKAGKMDSILKGSKGKHRQHIIHVNYVHRKLLEAQNIYEYHKEFPLLRTPSRVHALDDVMEVICKRLNIKFTRTAVVLPPRSKSKYKKRPVIP